MESQPYLKWFESKLPEIPLSKATVVIDLKNEDATIPFIARYRKERTGGLDEVQIQAIFETYDDWIDFEKRRSYILGEIEKQGKLSPELKAKLESTLEESELEDLYLPYKQKRKNKATLAREAGLQGLADWIWAVAHGERTPEPGLTLELWAYTFKNEEKGFGDGVAALGGAQDLLVEKISEEPSLRTLVRETLRRKGYVLTQKTEKAKPASKFEMYFSYQESVESLLRPENTHRYLAMRRGWIEEELSLTLGEPKPTDPGTQTVGFEEDLLQKFEAYALTQPDSMVAEIMRRAARIALKAHVIPSCENELQKLLKEGADRVAIEVFSENVRKLLLAAPLGPKFVLGVDPGVRTGCKLAVVNDRGKFIADSVIYLRSDEEKAKAKSLLSLVLPTGDIQAIAIGNGTGGREAEIFIRQTLKELGLHLPVVMVSEAGASVYSASEVAREEFPDLDLTVRSAISIARRLQDPLAELVKIDPKSIGVGQYQHDVSPLALKRSLETVVDLCVNSVGVNVNTASPYLLSRVSGVGPALARNLVEFRNEKGLLMSREDLRKVPRFSEKVFELAAGFLRIPESLEVLDHTAVHPERYAALKAWAQRHDLLAELGSLEKLPALVQKIRKDSTLLTSFKTEFGEFTSLDILAELERPGRDPRETFVPFQYREDIFELKDVRAGMICPGIVTNVTNFGAFVDIGVHQDGLVHLSQLAPRFVKDPRTVVSPGDRVKVKVLAVDLEKTQLSLSIKQALEPGSVADSETKPFRSKRGETQERSPRKWTRDRPQAPKLTAAAVGSPESLAIAPRGSSSESKPSSPLSSKPKRPEKPQFSNNPFSALAALKKDLLKR
jgi:uncharacterized protein